MVQPQWFCVPRQLTHTPQGPAGLGAGAEVATHSLGKSGARPTKHIQVRNSARGAVQEEERYSCKARSFPTTPRDRSPSR